MLSGHRQPVAAILGNINIEKISVITEYLNSRYSNCPGQVAQFVGASSHTPKGCGFNSQPGHIPKLEVQSPVWAHTEGNQSMFLHPAPPPQL